MLRPRRRAGHDGRQALCRNILVGCCARRARRPALHESTRGFRLGPSALPRPTTACRVTRGSGVRYYEEEKKPRALWLLTQHWLLCCPALAAGFIRNIHSFTDMIAERVFVLRDGRTRSADLFGARERAVCGFAGLALDDAVPRRYLVAPRFRAGASSQHVVSGFGWWPRD